MNVNRMGIDCLVRAVAKGQSGKRSVGERRADPWMIDSDSFLSYWTLVNPMFENRMGDD